MDIFSFISLHISFQDVNLSNTSFFSLLGEKRGPETVRKHIDKIKQQQQTKKHTFEEISNSILEVEYECSKRALIHTER